MTLQEAWQWLEQFTNLEKTPSATMRTWRLDRMYALLELRDHPEACALGLHVAGSKGKGSTAAFLASILTQGGWQTGLYTSPHVTDWRERITLNGELFRPGAYLEAVEQLKQFWDALPQASRKQFVSAWGGEPTTFEWLTLAAFELFRLEGIEARVLETGLGGRLDATNAQVPTASVITLIEREHVEILGDTLELIAGEKAGIIKPGVPVFVAPQGPEAMGVFLRKAKETGSRLYSFDREIKKLELGLERNGTRVQVEFGDGELLDAQLPVLGLAQGTNAAFAALVVKTLVEEGQLKLKNNLPLAQVLRLGLERVKLTGRMQVLCRDPWVVLDGAHTAVSIELLARSWQELFGGGGTLVFGAFSGKDIGPMAAALAPLFRKVVVTKPSSFRPSDPEAMAQAFRASPHAPSTVEIAQSPSTALQWALGQNNGGPILVCGSFYLVGEILSAF